MAAQVPERSEIPQEDRWSTESVFENDQAWEAEIDGLTARLDGVPRFHGHLGDGPSQLAEWFEEVDEISKSIGRIYVYAAMFHNADTGDQDAAARHDRARGLFARTMAAIAFSEPELLEIGFVTLRRWVAGEPRIAHLGHYLHDLERKQSHVRSAEVEELLGQLTDPFHSASAIHGTLADADLVFQDAVAQGGGAGRTVAQGTIDGLLAHPDREVRRSAWESYADAHLGVRNAMASCLATCVKQHVFLARGRGHGSCLESSLAEDNIPEEVFHGFLAAFQKNLPTWHRYFRLRKKALGYDELHPYDLKAPLSPEPPKVSFDQALQWIGEGMAPLGDEYVATLQRGVRQDRWVDWRANQGKRAGAFSTGWPGTHPFILMSWADDVFSLSTLAHELGHSMHSYRTWAAQPQIYAHYSIFVAEVASNFNQALVRAHLLGANPDRAFRIAVIEEAMANFLRYFFLMPTLARFELEIHRRGERGEPLTAEAMSGLMRDLFAEAYGDEVVMDDDRVGITWAQFPTHLYANFYVYEYGTGISAAQALVERVTSGVDGAVEAYLGFLAAGGSVYPIEALKAAGVDLSQPEPVDRAFAVLSRMVDQLAELLGTADG